MRRSLLSLAAMTLDNCKLTYFPIPGRGEASRLALAIGGISFTDERIPFGEWREVKPTTVWGSLPILTLSTGQRIAQQRAILRLIGKETGLYPTDDHVRAALIDSLMDASEDLAAKTNSQGQGLPQEEKEAARAKAVAKGGVVYHILEKIENFVGENGSNGYCVGSSLTIADLFLYTGASGLVSGLFDGVPTDALDTEFPKIMAVRKTVRAHEAVTKWYDSLDESIKMPASFGPFN